MDWKSYFTRNILFRGLIYYRKQKVKGLVQSMDGCMARVLGTRVYAVEITGLSGPRLRMSCTCAYAQSGLYCKHMAAVLYAWDAANGLLEETEDAANRQIRPFTEAEDDRSIFFQIPQMTKDLVFYGSTVVNAQELIEKKKILLDRVQLWYQGFFDDRQLAGRAVGQLVTPGGSLPLTADFDRWKVNAMECPLCRRMDRFGQFSYTKEPCVHETALLMLLHQYILRYNPGDATDWKGERILESFGRARFREQTEENAQRRPCVVLQPRVTREMNGYHLSFRVGVQKLYVVKKIEDLVKTVQNMETLELGKNARILFSAETFTAESQAWYDYLAKRMREIRLMARQMREIMEYYDIIKPGGSILLTGSAMDEFYDLAEGKTLEFQDKIQGDSLKQIRFRPGHPLIRLNIVTKESEEHKIEGVQVSGDFPEMIQGNSRQYFRNGDVISPLEEEDSRMLAPLMAAAEDGTVDFVVGLQKLPEFYYRILPGMQENPCMQVRISEKEMELLAPVLPPEARFAFYLDAEEGELFCRAEAAYDERKHDIRPLEEKDFPLEGYRDASQELRVQQLVEEFFPKYLPEKEAFCSSREDDTVFRILDSGVKELMRAGEVHATREFESLRIRKTPVLRFGVSLEGNMLDLEVVSKDLSQEELLSVLDSYRKRKKYHRLTNGDFILLEENETMEMLSEILESMNIPLQEFVKGKLHLPVYRALYLSRMLEEHEAVAADRDRHFRQLIKNMKTVNESDLELPPSLKDVMRNYQVYGHKWLRVLSEEGLGGILADDMGLGKTLQMISVLLAAKENGQKGTSLVVCPASLVFNWQEECRRFAPSLTVRTVTGTIGARKAILEEAKAHPGETDLLITSYDLLKRDAAYYEGLSFAWHVLDEAQYIKNPKASVSRSVKIIRSRSRVALTGTPIENRLSELWSIFDFLMPGYLYGYETFRRKLETPIVKDKDEQATARLRRMVTPFVLRRLKEDVLRDLPEKLEEVRYARFDDEQQHIYDGQVMYMRQMLEGMGDDLGKGRIRILAELTRIRQICCDPALLADYDGVSAKREACLELIESAIDGGHRMLVFSQFTSMLAILEGELNKRNIAYEKITGATPKEERLLMVHRFNEGDTPVFLISLKAGGTGLNLTGADVVIHYDPWWNVAAEHQAADRTHRIGQTKKVTVYKLIAKGTIEEKILHLQNAKADLSEAILSGQEEGLGRMSREELLELLEE